MSHEDGALLSILFKICLLNDMYIKITSFNLMHLFTHNHKPDYIAIVCIKLEYRIKQNLEIVCLIMNVTNI